MAVSYPQGLNPHKRDFLKQCVGMGEEQLVQLDQAVIAMRREILASPVAVRLNPAPCKYCNREWVKDRSACPGCGSPYA